MGGVQPAHGILLYLVPPPHFLEIAYYVKIVINGMKDVLLFVKNVV